MAHIFDILRPPLSKKHAWSLCVTLWVWRIQKVGSRSCERIVWINWNLEIMFSSVNLHLHFMDLKIVQLPHPLYSWYFTLHSHLELILPIFFVLSLNVKLQLEASTKLVLHITLNWNYILFWQFQIFI